MSFLKSQKEADDMKGTGLRPLQQWEYNHPRRSGACRWIAYNQDLQVKISNAYKRYDSANPSENNIFQFRLYGKQYEINFHALVQKNLASGFEREIRFAKHSHVGPLFDIEYRYSDEIDYEGITGMTRVFPPVYDPAEEDLMCEPLGDGQIEDVYALQGCAVPGKKPCCFKKDVIIRSLQVNPTCPKCGHRFELPGNQPTGVMVVHINHQDSCQGYEAYDAIVIGYEFLDGIQGRRMENPGVRYSGTLRAAFLPDTREGRKALRLLTKAFKKGMLFTVGTSITTGRPNTVVWGGIHQKTSMYGGVHYHGWPDPLYFDRLVSECMAVGVTDDSEVDHYGYL